jgi:hypothetical protein
MREFQNKSHFHKLAYSRYTLFFLFIVIIVLINAVWGAYDKYQKSALANERSKQSLDSLKDREKYLNQSIVALSTQEGKEREIREKFGLVKEDEKMVVFVGDTQATTGVKTSNGGWWKWLFELFR